MRLEPRAAAGVGYLAGVVFFTLNFSWFGETAGALLGPFGFLLDLGPSLIEGLTFGLAAALASVAARRLHGEWIAIVAAAAFTLAEVLRSSGLLGVPLYQIGAAFVDTPLAPLAAFGGVYALTFAVALVGASLGAAGLRGELRHVALAGAACAVGVGAAAGLAWWAWPARELGPATIRVAAVQGNITQSVKWQARSLARAVTRYTGLTRSVRAYKPAFVLWPETVITTDLLLDPELTGIPANAGIVAESRALRARFHALANETGAVIAVGSDEATAAADYNDLVFFTPGSPAEAVYRKRQLVPFAEFLPGPAALRSLPFAALVSNFGAGTQSGPIGPTLQFGPMICWEAGFTDMAQSQAARGVRFFAVATDDAWFGASDGPYAQAQLTQLRAIETGRWIVRAAATGISGIVAPDGRWRERTALDTESVVTGTIGEPQATVYARTGPWPFCAALAVLLLPLLRTGGMGRGSRAR
jgi:apolipoprotein N-acyltransferase